MIRMPLDIFADQLGLAFNGKKNVFFKKMVIDSRIVTEGDLFVAIKGEHNDGHDYINEAIKKGAVGIVSVGSIKKETLPATNYLFAESAEDFFKKTAMVIRKNTEAVTVGITGSVGKTTTKDMIYSVFSEHHACIKTEGNFNNELGLPLTMSRVDESTQYMILEMGMRGPGEIAYLADIARPKYAIITNIEPVHAELLGSIENIAKTKAEIAEKLPLEGALIINQKDEELLKPFIQNIKAPYYTVGFKTGSDFKIDSILLEEETRTEYLLQHDNKTHKVSFNAIGKHNMINSAMAYALGLLAQIPESSFCALGNITFTEMRFNIRKIGGYKIINDAYNANPSSVSYAIDSFTKVHSQRKIFIFGDMFELGAYEKEGHALIAKKILENNIDLIFLLGERVNETYNKFLELGGSREKIFIFSEKEDLVSEIKKNLKTGDAVLLKASRGMYFETIEKQIEEYINE